MAGSGRQEGADGVDVRLLLATLRRRAWLVLAVVVATVGPAAFLVLTEAPEYRATGVIRLVDSRRAVSGGLADVVAEQAMGASTDPLLSQIQLLRSRGVALTVVQAEGLQLRPLDSDLGVSALRDVRIAPGTVPDTFDVQFSRDVYRVDNVEARYGEAVEIGGAEFTIAARPAGVDRASLELIGEQQAIEKLIERLATDRRERTDVVEVSYTSTDPERAHRVVNGMIDSFQLAHEENAREQSRRRRVFVEEQLAETDSMLALAQSSLSAFRSRERVFSSRERFAAEQQGLQGLEVRRAEMAADRRMFQNLLNGIRSPRGSASDEIRTLVSSPGISSNPVIGQIYGQLSEYEATRDSLVAMGRPPNNPDVQRVNLLIANAQEAISDAAQSHIASLDARISALDELRAASSTEIEALPGTEAEEVNLVQQVETIRGVADQLRAEYQRARIAEAVEAGPVEVIDRAPIPFEPESNRAALKIAAALMVGLMLGGGGALFLERTDHSVRRREELENALQVPNLAIIPAAVPAPRQQRLRKPETPPVTTNGNGHNGTPEPAPSPVGRLGETSELVTIADMRSAQAEAFRTLRTNLLFSQAATGLKTIVVTSAMSGEGKTTTSANLAVTFAQQSMRVLLVDCDLRKARLDKVFGVRREPGLSELLRGEVTAADSVRPTSVKGLFLLPSGSLPDNPSELLGGTRMKALLRTLSGGFDMIVIDTPPLFAAADAAILGSQSSGVVMVVRAGQTERSAAVQAAQQLHAVGGRIIGTVLNDPDSNVPLYGGYYHYSYYGE